MSENPEEQPSTGVLGRIGSWFSPWRGKGPTSPTENASPTSDLTARSEGEESEDSVRPEVGERLWDEKEQSSKQNPLGPSRDILFCEEEDATKSAHSLGSVVRSSEAGEGGPKEEELLDCKKREERIGQGKEGSRATSVSGNPEKNASHLTHLSSAAEQGVAGNSDPNSTQPLARTQVPTGKRFDVYVEETSVTHCGKNTCIEQEVVRTKVKKSIQVLPQAKSSPISDSSSSLSSTAAENKSLNVRPAVGSQSYYSAPEGVSLKSSKDWQLEPEQEHTEANSMGRKNVAKRKSKKSPQGDGGSSPLEKVPSNGQPVPKGGLSSDNATTSPQGWSPNTHMGEPSANSSSKHNPTSLASPGGGERKTSCPETAEHLDTFQDRNSVPVPTLAPVVDEGADMEGDDSLYKVERKTETPESKRRSIKVSQSEVKLFKKHVPLSVEQSPAGDNNLDLKPTLKNTKSEAQKKLETEIDSRLQDLKKTDKEPKPAVGRIADRISLFEHQSKGGHKRTFRNPRSADVSPARTAAGRLKAALLTSDLRSRSAERYDTARSGSVSPIREIPMSVKERMKNFTKESTAALSRKPATTGMAQTSTTAVAGAESKSPELDSQGKLDTRRKIQSTAKSEITLKPDGRDTSAVGGKTSTPKEQHMDVKTKATLKAACQDTKPKSVDQDDAAKGADDSAEVTNKSKGPSRTGSRSKRKKSRDLASPTSPTNPTSPTSGNKPDHSASEQEVTAVNQQVDDTDSLPSQKQPLTVTKQFEPGVNKQEGLPAPPVSTDEPDTAASNGGTKKPFDKLSVILPQREEKEGGARLSFTEETKNASSASPSNEHLTQKTPSVGQDPPAHPKVDTESQSESKSKAKARQPSEKDTGQTQQPQNKDTQLINKTEDKELDDLERPEGKKTNQIVNTDKEKPQQLLPSDKSTNAFHSGRGTLGTMSVARDEQEKHAERKEEPQPVRDVTTASQPEPASESSKKTDDRAGPTTTTHPEKTPICAVTQTNEALSATGGGKGSSQGGVATNVLDTKCTESPTAAAAEPAVFAAEPQPDYVSVEKTGNSVNDSHPRGANGAEHSSSKPITRAATSVEGAGTEVADDPSLITAQTDNKASVQEPTSVPAPDSLSTFVPSEVTISGDSMQPAPSCRQFEVSKDATSTSDVASIKDAKDIPQSPSGCVASSPTFNVIGKKDEKTLDTPVIEISPAAKTDVSLLTQLQKDKKPSPTPTASTSPTADKLIPDSVQQSSKKKLPFPPRLSRDDFSFQQDAPSSWLDVDFPKHKLKVPGPKLTSCGSESNLLDTSGELDDDDFVEKIKKLCAPFSLPPRKHNVLRPPQPPFALPAIKEDRFEKTFDPEEFKFGLRKKKFTLDTTPSALAKLTQSETKAGLKPARISLADRSMLLGGLDTRFKNRTPANDEENVKEEIDDHTKVKSRLEGSCVLNTLLTTSVRAKRNGTQAQAEGTNSGDVSPSEAPLLSPPCLSQPQLQITTASAPLQETLAEQNPEPSGGDEAQAAESVVSDSGPPLPSFNDIKLPDYLEKYLPREPVQSIQGRENIQTEVDMTAPAPVTEAALAGTPGLILPDAAPPRSPGIPPAMQPPVPELKQPPPQPKKILSNKKRTAKGFHKRPGKMVLFEKAQFSGQVYDVFRDVADATSLQLSPVISVKVIRGCWILFEKPDFQGRSIALEEGGMELTNEWADTAPETEPHNKPPMLIGSIRLAVCDYSIPRIDLFTEPEGHGRVTPYSDDTIETGSFGIPLSTASIQVHSGVWLVFSDPGFQGMVGVLQTGVYPFPETWGFPSPFVGSLRPLKMGGFKVENPSEIKAVVYEKPGLEGSCLEIDSDIFGFCESEGDVAPDASDSKTLTSVGSLKISGGLWVGYSEPGFEGQQHILEEGEFLDCSDWGGSEPLLSLRPILSDFMSPHLKMFSDKDFSTMGVNIDLTVPVINMEDTGYGMRTQSIDVISGIWVAFEEPGFCGETYILEKGLYGCQEDWGALQPRVASAMPVVLDDFENLAKFKVQLFSDPGLQGSVLALEDSVASLEEGFSVGSCKVLAGSWLVFEGPDFTGRMYVLDEGSYPDLRAMGCVNASSSILSLQIAGFDFSLPSITLFERGYLRGKRVVLTDGSVNLQLAGGAGIVQSVLVDGGMWILYEGINYRGAQILLSPGEVPDWHSFSNWKRIGSLRPLLQRQVHFRLRNRQTGLMMSVTGDDLDDVNLMRIQETEENDGFEQIWSYQSGRLHSKLLDGYCLSPSGSVIIAGSRVGFVQEQDKHVHTWSITPEGFIRYTPTSDLVLEVKGGHNYDKNQVILNTLDPNKLHQRWNVEII